MAELVDAADLKSADGNVVGVQVPLPPSLKSADATGFLLTCSESGLLSTQHDLGTKKPNSGQTRHGCHTPPRAPDLTTWQPVMPAVAGGCGRWRFRRANDRARAQGQT